MSETPRPRVVLLRNQFLPYSETFIHDQLRHHRRYVPTVFARCHRNLQRFPGHQVVALETDAEAHRLRSLVYGVSGRAKLFDQALRDGQYSLIHAHFINNGAYALGFSRRHRLPLVISAHGHDVTTLISRELYHPRSWFVLAHLRRLRTETALVLCASEELRELLLEAGFAKSTLRVHRLGLDLAAIAPHRRQRAVPTKLVMVGRFVEKKGHLDGFTAFAEVRRRFPETRMVVIGDGPLFGVYRRRLAELGLEDQVDFPGSLPHERVLAELGSATVVVTPSVIAANLDRESGLMVAKEASALGVPVVGTWHGGIPEIVEDGASGFLVPERDPVALADRLMRLLSDPALLTRFGARAKEKMEREYDIRGQVEELEALYDEVKARFQRQGHR